MFDWAYKKRLKDDLEHWVSRGWLMPEGARAILEDQDRDDGRSRLPLALAGIGLVCVALALFAFIAANWELIPKAVKLAGIVLLVAASHGLAAWTAGKGRKGLADLLTGFATLVFIGGLALIGQIFHLPSDWAGGALLICLGGLAAAWLTGSRSSLVIASAAAVVWQCYRIAYDDPAPLEELAGFAILAAVFVHAVAYPARTSRWAAICLLWATYAKWFADTGDDMKDWNDAVLVMGVAGSAALAVLMMQLDALADLFVKWSSDLPERSHGRWLMARSLQDAGMVVLCLILVFSLIVVPEISDDLAHDGLRQLPALMPLALAVLCSAAGLTLSFKTAKAQALFAVTAFALATVIVPVATLNILVLSSLTVVSLIGLCVLGTWYNNRFWMLCAYLSLTAVALWLLQVTIGSLLGQSLFFLVAGVILLAVALWLARLFRGGAGTAPPADAPAPQEAGA